MMTHRTRASWKQRALWTLVLVVGMAIVAAISTQRHTDEGDIMKNDPGQAMAIDIPTLTSAPLRAWRSLEVGAHPDHVFALISETHQMPTWVSGLREVVSVDHTAADRPGSAGVGTVRVLRFGNDDLERFVAWDPPRGYGYSILRGAPVRNHLAVMTVEPGRAAGSSIVSWYQYFDIEWRSVAGWLMPYRVGGFMDSSLAALRARIGDPAVAYDR